MNLNEFLKFRQRCITCGAKNSLIMNGTMQERVGDAYVHCVFNYMLPVVRKDFLTFAIGNFAAFSSDESLDMDTFNKNKYNTFILDKNNIISFDIKFEFKMKINFTVICPDRHYGYHSRSIRLSNKSPDISKGYPVISEDLIMNNYKIISNKQNNTTSIYNFESTKDPVVIPYMDVAIFQSEDSEKFIKKVQNILLLA